MIQKLQLHNISLPLVSVIIPAYNAEKFIEGTLNSVLSQSYSNIEVLVVDDGSQDRTVDLVKSFAQKDHRITLLTQANSGVAAARNLAIKNAQGEYIAPLDADDIWYSEKIAKQVECMLLAGKSCGLVYTWSVGIDQYDAILDADFTATVTGKVYPALVCSNFVGGGSVPLIRRSCFEKIGYYNTQFKLQQAQGCEDWELYLRIAEYYEYQVVPEFLTGYRHTLSSMSGNSMVMLNSYLLLQKQIQQRHPQIPSMLLQWSKSQFYINLAYQNLQGKQYQTFLSYLYQAIKYDPAIVMSLYRYKLFIKYTTTILIDSFKNPFTQLAYKLIFKSSKKSSNQYRELKTIQRKINQKKVQPWNIYQIIQQRRQQIIKHLCEQQLDLIEDLDLDNLKIKYL